MSCSNDEWCSEREKSEGTASEAHYRDISQTPNKKQGSVGGLLFLNIDLLSYFIK